MSIPTPADYGDGPHRDFYNRASVLLSAGHSPSELAQIVQDALAWLRQERSESLSRLPAKDD